MWHDLHGTDFLGLGMFSDFMDKPIVSLLAIKTQRDIT